MKIGERQLESIANVIFLHVAQNSLMNTRLVDLMNVYWVLGKTTEYLFVASSYIRTFLP